MRRLLARLRVPEHLTPRVRYLFLLLALGQFVLVAPYLVLPTSAGPASRLLSTAAMVLLAAWWVVGYRRGRFPLWGELLEAVLVAASGVGLGNTAIVLGVVYYGLSFRSLYGGHALAVWRAALYVAATEALVIAVPSTDSYMQPGTLLGWLLPSLVLSSITTRVLSRVLARHDEGRGRDRALLAMARDLIQARRRAEVDAALGGFAARLPGLPADATFEVDVEGDGGARSEAPGRVTTAGSGTVRLRTADTVRPDLLPALEMLDTVVALALENVALQEQLSHRASHDTLTALPNRSLFADEVRAALSSRTADRVAVMFVDLDDFKGVNDGMGHAAGDILLAAVAGRLRARRRDQDTLVARLGGDEFAVLMRCARDADDAIRIAERLLEGMREPFEIDGRRFHVGTSIGIALGAPGDDAEVLLRNADTAMYVAKARGKGRYEVFTQSMHDAVNSENQLRDSLSVALERDELALFYQPIVDVATGEVTACEALMRWHHPEQGLVPPNTFIPVAERSGQIIALERWALVRACTDATGWPPSGSGRPVDVSVNVSPVHLAHPDVVTDVRTALTLSGLDPTRLVVEVTESVAALDHRDVVDALTRIRALGVRVALDDFGTGYSSLGALSKLPVDIVKIDKSFADREDRATLTKAVIDMSTALNLVAVAEGVESPDQEEALREIGCPLAQGYLFSRPVPAADIVGVLRAQSRLPRR